MHALYKAAEVVFWVSIALIAYGYVLYPMLLFGVYVVAQVRRDLAYILGRGERRAKLSEGDELPSVSIIVPAYNEAARIAEKVANLKTVRYPAEKLEVIFVSDGSTDGTNEILTAAASPSVRVLILPKREGKANALNQAVAAASGDVLVMSDATTMFAPDTVQMLARHFANPKVGCVCGTLRFEADEHSRNTEGVFWNFESMLRLMEARVGATLTASGALYALRRSTYVPVPASTIIEDFIIPMNVRKLGYSVLYDPESVATEFAASSVRGEFKRRVRIATGSFRSLGALLRMPLGPLTTWSLVSHKILRWIVPFIIFVAVGANALLVQRPLYRATLACELLGFTCALLGYAMRGQAKQLRYLRLAYYGLAMNLAFIVGLYRVLVRQDEVKWERVA